MPGGVVAASQGGHVVLRQAFGLASLEHGAANTVVTRFPIGSVTKHMTCAALLRLEQEGLLRMDDGIRRWLPELPLLRGEPTLRQLAEHMGGHRCYLDVAFCDGFAMQPGGAGLAMQVRQRDANFAPGASQRYSNGGYLMLSLAMERASGERFEDVLRSRLFEPLSLSDTESVRSDTPLRTRMATGHVPWAGGGWARGLNISEERLGDGAVVSTADDMLSWARHLRASGLLDRLAVPSKTNEGPPGHYGMGLLNEEHRGLHLVGHGGGVMGANSQLFWVPAHDVEVVVLCNGPAPARALALAVVESLLEQHLDSPPVPVPSSAFTGPRGLYRVVDTGMVLELADAPEGLAIGLFGAPPSAVLRPAQTCGAGTTLPFVMPGATHPFGFEWHEGHLWIVDAGTSLRAEHLDQNEVGPSSQALAGRYRCVDLDAEIELHREGDALKVRARGPWGRNDFNVCPMPGGLLGFRHAWMPWFAVAVPRQDGCHVNSLTLSTARTRALEFERCT